MANIKARNTYVDVMRGIAMLLVVLGHTMTGSTDGSEESFLFNIIWALQMPMFILISGYVTRYGKGVSTGEELIKFVKKRTISYLMPWIVWTALIRGLIFQNHNFLNPGYILWHMDTGYWFLFSIWTIAIIYGFSDFLAGMLCKQRGLIYHTVILGIFYCVGMGILAGMGLVFGLSFLGIKHTLYYMPFFFAGFLFGRFQESITSIQNGVTIIEIIVAGSLVVWLASLVWFNLYEMADSGLDVIIRAVTSLAGCIAIIGLVKNLKICDNKIGQALRWCGIHSLEIYLVHDLLLNLMQFETKPSFMYASGIILVMGNFILTVILCVISIKILNSSKILKRILFGKK